MEGRIIDVDSLPPVTELDFEKEYNLTDDKKKKLVVNKVSFINVEETAKIKNGIWLKNSAVLQGDGLKNVSVRVTPKKEPIIVDFSGADVKEVIIEKSDLVELRGAENIKKLTIK